MSVWLVLPSKRPSKDTEAIFRMWLDQGYKVMVQVDLEDRDKRPPLCDIQIARPYSGYAEAVNFLVASVLNLDPDCQWLVTAGDDTQPDLNHTAEQIAAECAQYSYSNCQRGPTRFGMPEAEGPFHLNHEQQRTMLVMQPTGDRWGDHRNTHPFTPRPGGNPALQLCSQCGRAEDNVIHSMGAYIDRVAGSPWMGREFCKRVNQGKGPLWPGYFHMGCDEELQAVATRLGVFWQRPDLIHLHQHWGRGVGDAMGSTANMPDFLTRANSREEWGKYKVLFAEREAAGFPGSEPL